MHLPQVAQGAAIDGATAAVVVQNPIFFGTVQDFTDLFAKASAQGALTIMLILVGGTAALKALQTASIAAAFPFMLIMLVMCYSIIVALREDSAAKK